MHVISVIKESLSEAKNLLTPKCWYLRLNGDCLNGRLQILRFIIGNMVVYDRSSGHDDTRMSNSLKNPRPSLSAIIPQSQRKRPDMDLGCWYYAVFLRICSQSLCDIWKMDWLNKTTWSACQCDLGISVDRGDWGLCDGVHGTYPTHGPITKSN